MISGNKQQNSTSTLEELKAFLEALPGGGGGSQVACRNFKMLRVGVLSRLKSLSEIKGQLLQFFVTNSRL